MGWKKPESKVDLAGNPEFQVTPEIDKQIKEFRVESAYTPEDAAFEAEIQSLGKDQPDIQDQGPVVSVQKTRESLEHLKFHADEEYKPASTLAELDEQVFMAKSHGADSVDGTEALVRAIFRQDFDQIKRTVGYGIYHDIRVYIAGAFEDNKSADKLTMEQKLFPKG